MIYTTQQAALFLFLKQIFTPTALCKTLIVIGLFQEFSTTWSRIRRLAKIVSLEHDTPSKASSILEASPFLPVIQILNKPLLLYQRGSPLQKILS